MKITEVKAREILDSRGTPTVQAVVTLGTALKERLTSPPAHPLVNTKP